MARPSFGSTTIPKILALNIGQILILLAIFALIGFAARLSVVVISGRKQFGVTGGVATFARFFYASFLKPHNGDGAITGQQAALESFYKAQVMPHFASSSVSPTGLQADS